MMDYPEYTTLFEGWGIGPDGFGRRYDQPCMEWWPLTLLSQKVCGIEPTSPGFRSFKVCPQMGTLTEASATVDTHFGKIEVSLKRKGKKIQATLSVPEGTTAEVIWPRCSRKNFDPGRHQAENM